MLILARLASAVRHQRACCYWATLITGLTVIIVYQHELPDFLDSVTCYEFIRKTGTFKIEASDWTTYKIKLSPVSLLGVWHLMECHPGYLASIISFSPVIHTAHFYYFIHRVHLFGCASCDTCAVLLCRVWMVTLGRWQWGRKDSIVYPHLPWIWRWTTMVRSNMFFVVSFCIISGH